MSRIDLQIVGSANFAQIEAALTRLKSQLATINSMQITGVIPANAQGQLDRYLQTFRDTIDASGMYQRQLVSITNETEKFGRGLERGNLRLGQLYRSAMDYRRTEMGQIRQLAREQVRLENSMAIARGGGMAEVFTPRGIDEGIEKHRILSQEYRILGQVIRNGSTELINWGKNTQWAGRQLTVGLTVPITIFGAAAAKAFMDADKQLTRLSKVYGDATKGMANSTELQQIRDQALGLAQDIASTMGVSVTETLGVAADIAATGKEGNELLSATNEAMRLSVLGEVDRQEAMRATLAIQTVFKQSTEGLTESINFLNAVENQTSTSLNDLVTGIVKAGPVVQGLGGSIEDLALMLVAMREGGVPASEAANAIKSSLGALINPTKQTTQVLGDFGINLKEIVDSNAGDVIGTLVDLQSELEGLDELSRQRSIEQIFGKFQFSRINALLNNLNKAGSQTEQVLALAEMSTSQLAETAQKELEAVTQSVTGRFTSALESLKANLIPIGETFTEVGTILLNVGSRILEIFNALPEPVQNFFKLLTLGTAVIGPLIMITGVLGNFFGYLVKGMSTLMLFKKEGREAFRLITPESIATTKATELLTESLFDQKVAVDTMAAAIDVLISKLESLQVSMNRAASTPLITDEAVLANAEARAVAARPRTMYSAPDIPFAAQQRSGGRVSGTELTWTGGGSQRIEYSHILGKSIMEDILGKENVGRRQLLGMGSWTAGGAAEVQQEINSFMRPRAVDYSEEIMTPEFRKEELLRMAQTKRPSLGEGKYAELVQKIQSLSDQELAQLLPSWEKIRISTSEFMGILSSAADGLKSENAQTRADVKAALDKYRQDSLLDPSAALDQLRMDLREAGIQIENRVDTISAELDKIRSEALQIQDPDERTRYFEKEATERIVDPYELESYKQFEESKVSGFGKKQGYQYALAAEIEKRTNQVINEQQLSAELMAAYERHSKAKDNLRQAEERYEQAVKNSVGSQERIDNANDRLATELERRKLSDDFTRGENGQWMYKTGKAATGSELIAALDAREAAILDASKADRDYADSSERLADMQDRERQTSEMLERAKKEEIKAIKRSTQQEKESVITSERNQRAEELDTKETLNSANAERKDADASRRLAAAENRDATATGGSTGSKGGIMGMFTKEGGKLSGLGAGVGSALSMATMFMPTGDNEALNTATNILGGAGMGASMGAMAGPWGALAGGIIGAAIPAVTSYVDAQQKANDALVRYSQAVSGAAGTIEGFGAELGRRSPTERLNEALTGLKIPEQAQQAAQSILEGQTGQALLNSARSMSGGDRADMLLNQLKQLTLSEVFTPDEAKAVAQELAIQLGDPELGRNLVNGIVSVLDSEGKLIRDAISGQFVQTLPGVEEIMRNAPATTNVSRSGFDTQVYTGTSEQLIASMSLTAGTLKQVAEAESMVRLSFQNGEITRKQYSEQMADINEKNMAAKEVLTQLIDAGAARGVNLVGIESVLGDIAAMQGVTEEFDKVVGKVKELQDVVGTTDVFAVPLQTAAAYGQLAAADLQRFQDIVMSDPEIQTTVTAIFDQQGSEEYALEIIRMINSGMDASKIKLILETEGVAEGVTLINTFNASLATLPPETQANIISKIDYNPQMMNEFISDYDYINSLPDTNKELRAVIFGNDELTEIQENWKAFSQLSDTEKKTAIISAIYNVDYNYATPTAPTPVAPTEIGMPSVEDMANAAFGGSGGGGGGGSDSASKAIDKKIAQQDKIIKSIQKEREERQKLLDLEKKALDFAMQQQDLESQIMIAKAEGRIADAALLQSQLDASRIQEREDEKERLRQEAEDKRIARAERRKKELERDKEKLSGGSGGGGGGSNDAAIAAMQNRLQFLNGELQVALQGNQEILDDISTQGAAGFWNSEPIKRYIEEAVKAGVPLEIVNAELEKIFDFMVSEGFKEFPLMSKMKSGLEDVGVAGESLNQVLPNIFAAFSDPSMDKDQFLKYVEDQFRLIGMNADEAETRAREFYETIPSYDRKVKNSLDKFNETWETVKDQFDETESEIIAAKFAEGIRRGATKKEILDSISEEIYKSTYTNGIEKGLDPIEASRDAWFMAQAVKSKTKESMKDFDVDVPFVSSYDDAALPDWLRSQLGPGALGAANKGMRAQGMEVSHRWANDTSISADLGILGTTSKPMVVTGTVSIDGNARGGLIFRGTGGMIYGPGGPTEDRIPTMLSNGEYVIRAASVKKYGIPFLDMLNRGMLPMMGRGGYSKYPSMVNGMSMGGGVYYNRGGSVNESSSNVEYNINVSVAGSNASADDIAREVMSALERKQKMSKTVNRI